MTLYLWEVKLEVQGDGDGWNTHYPFIVSGEYLSELMEDARRYVEWVNDGPAEFRVVGAKMVNNVTYCPPGRARVFFEKHDFN